MLHVIFSLKNYLIRTLNSNLKMQFIH